MKKKKIISILVAVSVVFCLCFINSGASGGNLESEVAATYKNALSKAGRSSFHGSCNLATAYQLLSRGIFKDGLDYSDAGNLWYDHYSKENKTSGGYNVITVSGKNCLKTLIDNYGGSLSDIVYSLGTGGASGSVHVLYIRAIENNRVYFTDSFGITYGKKYYPEGACAVLTADAFISSYKEMNGDPCGLVYFSKNESPRHIEGTAALSLARTYREGSYRVSASSLFLREKASDTSKILGKIPKGEIIDVTSISGNWGETAYNGVKGYVCLDFTEESNISLTATSLKSEDEIVKIGSKITWDASHLGGKGTLKYEYQVYRDNYLVFTEESESSELNYTPTETGEYQCFTLMTDQEESKAAIYSESVVCVDFIPGDIDDDGKVTATDARSALRCSSKLENIGEGKLSAADVDKNGKVTSTDARTILRLAAGVDDISKFVIEKA